MRFFTIDEAEALLPSLREAVLNMQRCKREVDALRETLSAAAEHSTGNGHVKNQEELAAKRRRAEALVEELNGHLGTINAQGVELKDVEMGLLDFASDLDGRVVYLCWRLGDERIAWWHETDAGYAARQPL